MIVQAGRPISASELKSTSGHLATVLRNAIRDADAFRIQLESWPDSELITLGLTQEEVNAQKGFYVGDLPTMRDSFASSSWVKQLLGTGI